MFTVRNVSIVTRKRTRSPAATVWSKDGMRIVTNRFSLRRADQNGRFSVQDIRKQDHEVRMMVGAYHDKAGEIFGQFRGIFPMLEKAVTHYGPWGGDRIRIEMTSGIKLIFEYVDYDNWALITEVNEEMRLDRTK